MRDPISGPIPRERFKELTQAPFGKARREIQQYDPFWGREPGEKIPFEVKLRGDMYGTATVEAATQEEADKLADKINDAEIDWCDGGHREVLSVKPRQRT